MIRSLRPLLRRLGLLAASLPLIVLLGGCTVNPATGEENFTAFMSWEDEAAVGRQEHPKTVKQFGGAYGDAYGGGRLAAYVARVGRTLARVSDVPDLAYTFTLLNSDQVNAFALPGGYVYITRGLLAMSGSEAEMAGVLAHEIGHITARHMAQRYSSTVAANFGLTVLGVLGSAAGLPPGLADMAVLGTQAYLRGFSREQELEADMLGVRYLTRAGYDPRAMVGFFDKLARQKRLQAVLTGRPGEGENYSFMSTHPRTAERLAQAISLARVSPVRNPRVGRDDYLAQIDGMIFGDDPSQGIRRGRVFSHPVLEIQFQVPAGFSMFNSPGLVIAFGPGRSLISFDSVGGEVARLTRDLPDFVARRWGRGLPLRNLEKIFVNGMVGATAEARVETKSGPRDLRLLVIRERQDRLYRFLFIATPGQSARLNKEFRRTTYSFRRLSAAEAEALRPLRLRVVTVRPGDTPASLADPMPLGRYRLEWFLVLNGLDRGARLSPGKRVKVVTE